MPIQRRVWSIDQSYELHRSEMLRIISTRIAPIQGQSIVKKSHNEGNSQKEITDFFRIQTHSSDKQDSQQALDSTSNYRGVLINRATELGRSRRPKMQKSSKHRWRIHHKVRSILVRHGRKPMRTLSTEDVEKLRLQSMLGLLGPSLSRFGSRS